MVVLAQAVRARFNQRSVLISLALASATASVGCAASPPAPAAPVQAVIPELASEPTLRPSPVPPPKPAPAAGPSDIVGVWLGDVVEAEEALEYRVCMEVRPGTDGPGLIHYFGALSCSGAARYESSDAEVHTFAEALSTGSDSEGGDCAAAGKIEAELSPDGSLAWRWFDPDSTSPRATATLYRQPACPH